MNSPRLEVRTPAGYNAYSFYESNIHLAAGHNKTQFKRVGV